MKKLKKPSAPNVQDELAFGVIQELEVQVSARVCSNRPSRTAIVDGAV